MKSTMARWWVLLFLVLVIGPVLCGPVWGEPERRELVILHVNDTHGHLLRSDVEGGPAGGEARLATLVQDIRREKPGEVLLLHAGDVFSQADGLTVYSGGRIDYEIMNRLKYDAYTPGNGEFYWGIENLFKQRRVARFPILHANIAFKDTGELLFPPFCIVKRGGVKVGVLGLGLVRMEHPAARSLSYLDPVGVAAKYVPILREQADLVLVLSHLGHEADVELGSKVRGIDIIVGGHEHEPLLEPLRIPGPSGGKDATLVRSGVYGQWLGRIDLKLLRENGRYAIEDLKWRRIPIDASISEDKKVVKRLKKYAIPLKEVICESKVHLDAPKEGKSPLGNLVAEAVLSATDADVALLDRGTAQGSIQPGPVTLGAVLNVHVFRNGILLLSMTGAEIERAIAENDLYFAGCSFTRTQGGKGCASLAIQGKPVTLDGRYTVAMNDYFQGSTPALRDLAAKPTGIRVDVALADYLREQRVISAEATGAPAAP